jgi:hypothetical protein
MTLSINGLFVTLSISDTALRNECRYTFSITTLSIDGLYPTLAITALSIQCSYAAWHFV